MANLPSRQSIANENFLPDTDVEGSVGLDVAFGSHKNGYEGENKRSVGLDVAFGSHKDGYEGENKGSVGLDVAFGSHKNGYEGEA